MFVVNDMEFLARLGRCKILDQILIGHIITISAIKQKDYTLLIEQQLRRYPTIQVLDQDEDFPAWCVGKNRDLTAGDLSSVYIAMQQADCSLVISDEDLFLEPMARQCTVTCLSETEFLMHTTADPRLLQLYNLIKTAS